jgi:hypothetical protein
MSDPRGDSMARPWLSEGAVGWAYLDGALTFGWTVHPEPFSHGLTESAYGVLFDPQDYYFMYEEEPWWDSVGDVEWNAVDAALNDEVRSALWGQWDGTEGPIPRTGRIVPLGSDEFAIPDLSIPARDLLRRLFETSPLVVGVERAAASRVAIDRISDPSVDPAVEAECLAILAAIATTGEPQLDVLDEFAASRRAKRGSSDVPLWFAEGLLPFVADQDWLPPEESVATDVVGRARNLAGYGTHRWVSDSWPPAAAAAAVGTL